MKKILLLSSLLFLSLYSKAQELDVSVTVNTPRLQTTDPRVFENLGTAIQEFMNNQKWTDDVFEDDERIKVELILTITDELSPVQFGGELAIQSTRPVFGTTDETPLLNHYDKDFLFEYEQFQPLEFTENQFQNNLTAVLSFYAYIILAMDYDSFSPSGGEPFYQKAQEIINNIPPNIASTYKGWRSSDSNRNRYWILENLLSPRMRDYRQAMYDYHRQGLDLMHKEPSTGRALITQAIQQVQAADKTYPRTMIMQMFSNAKSAEIVEIFMSGTQEEKDQIISAMGTVDRARASIYRAIRS